MSKRDEDTKSDRTAPLPSITAPSFREGRPPPDGSDVSVTSPVTVPSTLEEEERTRTATTLDPSAYVATPDKDPDELSSEFQPASGKQLDAGGRLVAQAAEAAPIPPQDMPPTEVAVPPRSLKRHALAPAPAELPELPVSEVAAQRSEPGRWILKPKGSEPEPRREKAKKKKKKEKQKKDRWIVNQEGHFAPEDPEPELEAFDPTLRRAMPKPPPPWRRIPRPALAGAAVLLVVAIIAGAWSVLGPSSGPQPAPSPTEPPAVAETPRIRITSKPSGAAVKINGMSFGATPVDRESPFAPEAELEVEVALKGYRPWTRRFHAGQSMTTHVQLKPGK